MGEVGAASRPGAVVGHLAGLYRYPVKSLGGERPVHVEVDERGVVGDRLWAVTDTDGRFGSGKTTRRFRRMPGLLELQAAYDGEVPVVRFPDGRTVRGDDPAVHVALSAHVGRPVTLTREGAVPHADEGPVHLVTTASLRAAGAAGPGVDPRRTRANLLVDTAAVTEELLLSGAPAQEALGFVEDGWVGRRLHVGTVELSVTATMPRCVMLGMAQGGLPEDRSVLREVLRRHDGHLGLVADVHAAGAVTVGDEVRLV